MNTEITENIEHLSNKELCKKTNKFLDSLAQKESILKDISSDITNEEILDKIALLKGQSISVVINRGDFIEPFKVIVSESKATIRDIKNSIRRNFELEEKRKTKKQSENSKNYRTLTKISWKYIWRTYLLDYNGERLTEDNRLLSDYGIKNKSVLNFIKKKTKN